MVDDTQSPGPPSQWDGRPVHGYARACLELYKDKLVEVNTGEQKSTLLLSDFELHQRSLIRGFLRGAIYDALLIECSSGKKGAPNTTVLVNCWTIISVTEVDGKGGMKDIYIEEEFRANRRVP